MPLPGLLPTTLMLTVAILLLTVPSLTRKRNESVPVKFGLGVYCTTNPVPTKDPCAGCWITLMLRVSPSASVAFRLMVVRVLTTTETL